MRRYRDITHDRVMGELTMASLKDRHLLLESLLDLPRAPLAEEAEGRNFIEARGLFARGIGYSDAHILASTLLHGGLQLWTRDRRLVEIAGELTIAYQQA